MRDLATQSNRLRMVVLCQSARDSYLCSEHVYFGHGGHHFANRGFDRPYGFGHLKLRRGIGGFPPRPLPWPL